jgi:hypothetical protein
MANTRVTTPVTDFDKSTSLPGLKLPSGTNANQPSGVQGMIRNDTGENTGGSTSAIEHHNGTNWQYFAATESPDPINGYYLVVAGGAGGGIAGGGAGGYRTSFGTGNINGGLTALENPLNLTLSTTYTVTVGAGGAGANHNTRVPGYSGGNSAISGANITTITSTGGGGGGTAGASGPWTAGVDGGSGGGSHDNSSPGAAVTNPVQGFAGGLQGSSAGGGGGGAGSVGNNNTNGGTGLASTITGSSSQYAGGGGGYPSGGGTFGGGTATTGTGGSGTANTGGGGGSGLTPGTGGSGIVILRYPVGNSINIISGTSPIAADLNAAVAGSTTEKFTRFTATGAVTFTIS